MSLTLRPYQEDCVRAVAMSFQTHQKVGVIVPTGGGKTEMFIRIAQLYLKHNPGKSVLVLSHLGILTQQTLERFEKRAPDLKVGVFQADKRPPLSSKVIIGTMQTSRDKSKTVMLKALMAYPVGLIIVDEAHYIETASYQSVLSYFPTAKVLGCTATPFRAGAVMTQYFDTVAYSISIKELIDAGYLVNPKLIEVALSEKDIEDRMATVAGIYKEREMGKPALVFMDSIESAKQMRNVLDSKGIRARAITSELVGDARDALLADFRDGKIDVLTTVNVLTAGFDAPAVEAIFMPFPTQSPVTYLQRIGRGLRPSPSTGKTDCRVYVCGDAPSIKTEIFQKVHQKALETGGKKRKQTTFAEDLEYNEHDKSSEVYLWTVTVCNAIRKMEDLGMSRLAKMLNEKRFPKKFLNDITGLVRALPPSPVKLPSGELAMTDDQKRVLVSDGFLPEDLTGITKNEASAMIALAINMKSEYRKTPFVIASGKYAGQHVKNTSWYYRNWIMEKNPNGEVGRMIKEWEAQGGKYEKSKGR
jgi:superfamily II DNA or RNA helicase